MREPRWKGLSVEVAKIYDVIIAGCGPVGATMANLLGHRGISTLVIEPEREPYDLPRAIHIDHEIVRILQSAGLADELVPTFSTPTGSMVFGADGSVIRPFNRNEHSERLGWVSDYFIYQPDMEKTLRSAMSRHDAVQVAWGFALRSLEQDADGVTATIAGTDEELRVRGRYLLGCDGGRSTVRREAGIALDDLGFDEPWVVVDALVDGPVTIPDFLDVPMNVDMQDVMFTHANPKRPTSVMPGVGKHRRWEFMLLPGEGEQDFADGSRVQELMGPWIAGQSYEIIRSAVYSFHALLAEEWQNGRIFLVGDAAHQTPPFFGQGLCHGIRDAANLAWKLDLVLNSAANEEILTSYQIERYPQVRTVIEAAVRTGQFICTLDPDLAKARDKQLAEQPMTPPVHSDLIPPLVDGIIAAADSDGSPVGARFIQPPMVGSNGQRQLLDEFTGDGFVLFGRDGLASQVAASWKYWAAMDVEAFDIADPETELSDRETCLIDVSGELCNWFDHFGCNGLLLRPDAYVYGVFSSNNQAIELLERLRSQLG